MSDFGESVPVTEQELGIKPSEKVDPWKGLKLLAIKNKASEFSWANNITKKKVDFPRANGKLVWGIEVEIPLRFEGVVKDTYSDLVKQFAQEKGINITQEEIQQGVEENEGKTWFRDIDNIALPKNIKKIRILDLSPQEALPKNQRSIDSKRNFWHDKYVTVKLTGQPSSLADRAMLNLGMSTRTTQIRSEALQDIFYDVFSNNKAILTHFREKLEKSGAEEILIINAHGGYDDVIGEQGYEVSGKDAQFQAEGNRIALTEVLDKYDQPEKYGAILVATCYKGKEIPRVGKVDVYRPYGFSGGGHPSRNPFSRKNTTLISEHQE